jgi:hypothetical protein
MSEDDTFDEYDEEDRFSLSEDTIKQLRSGDLDEDWDEEDLLIVRYIDGMKMRELGDPSVQQITTLAKWYNKVMVTNELLDLVLKGDAYISFDEDDEDVDNPTFSLSYKGKKRAEDLKETLEDMEEQNGWE